jgi:hypothetical protein
MRTKFSLESLKGRDHSGDLDVDGDNIKTDRRKIGWESVDWTNLAQYRDRWRVLVNTEMNLWVP